MVFQILLTVLLLMDLIEIIPYFLSIPAFYDQKRGMTVYQTYPVRGPGIGHISYERQMYP
jgi:hypothetical protein